MSNIWPVNLYFNDIFSKTRRNNVGDEKFPHADDEPEIMSVPPAGTTMPLRNNAFIVQQTSIQVAGAFYK